MLLDEWCFYLKAAEAAAGTAVGKLLVMDEAGGVGKQAKLSGPAGVNPKDKKALSVAAREKARRASPRTTAFTAMATPWCWPAKP